ncbi:acylneuraminate cytidylyltransferase [Butyrivibrio sp. CB08]|uniref:acylneuraminate cytidylyltransferase n=1 Tax=Butyrivibrio sp. CB08 TaxID=2364879 RepID=UPI000EAA62C3|nr:acylneuraminate cytidylyltransferase [Butyrivibrio sp. CB08]RKM60402.1 acylneuraminate cytidylyltransferase [Butyrivibrio sp. CB08]
MNVALIPVRGGSKSIPLKNIKNICGKPLVYWTARAACECQYINEVYIATDSIDIKRAVESFCESEKELFQKLKVVDRDPENATDSASTESVMLEFSSGRDFDNIVLIQATSPLLTCEDLDGGFKLYDEARTDSVLSVVRQKRFLWQEDQNGFANPSNYDVFNRPRRQDFDGYLMENGAFYITSKQLLEKTKNRIAGNIRAYEMPEDSALEIDEPDDFLIIEKLLQKRLCGQTDARNKNIKMVVTDCDGCLTDGGMYYSENGDELKKFNTKDGMALARLKERGVVTGIITGELRKLNERRAAKLHMDFLEGGVADKASVLKEVCSRYGIALDEVLYIGDDLNDVAASKLAGVSACPKDADKSVKKVVDYISCYCGGHGAVRDIIDHFFE